MTAPTDVAIVGFGPVGATLAGLLARRGMSVVVLDQSLEPFPLPRAAHVDHEALRILQEVGCADAVVAEMRENVGMDFLDASREVLLRFRSPGRTASGWPASVLFHQPALERTLRATVAGLGVETRLGVEVIGIEPDEDGVTLELDDGSTLRAAWVVGCDGARSFVRKALGIEMDDLEFEEPWLVVDLVLERDVPQLPDRALQVCDPARPHTLVPMPPPRFRFEFMLLPGEDAAEMQEPATVQSLLATWIDPGSARIERSAVYEFHGLIAREWRHGRVLLAGDAAHQMPPFLGQGMCSGMRDAANLAWKLDLVNRRVAPESLLDTYQDEREPHVRAIVELAVAFGRTICTIDPAAAAARDAALHAGDGGEQPTPNAVPRLRSGPLVLGAGECAPQPVVDGARLDDLVGPRFVVVAREPSALEGPAGAFWRRFAVLLDVASHPTLAPVLDGRGDVVVVRPDRYVLGAASTLEALTVPVRGLLGGEVDT